VACFGGDRGTTSAVDPARTFDLLDERYRLGPVIGSGGM
jgi:hypothetical protein